MVRVLFVSTATAPPLGADTWIHVQILRRLDPSNHEVHVACNPGSPDRPTPTATALRDVAGLRVTTVDLGSGIETHMRLVGRMAQVVRTLAAIVDMVRLAALVRRRKIDVIHTSDRPRDAVACVLVSKVTRRPCLVHVHVKVGSWMSGMLRWSLHHADHLVAVSQFVADSLVADGIAPERVHVVLNAIDVEAWTPGRGRDATRRALGLSPEAPVLLSVSRLFPEKGPADAIRALAIVRREWPAARLLIVGAEATHRPGYQTELRRLAEDLELGDAVCFLGHRTDVEGLMAAADLYVMPSFEEPFGLVFVEAMAMGLPVVALDNGGTREVVEHGRSGLLSAPQDLDGLAANVAELLRDRDARTRMGKHGRRQAAMRFDARRMATDMARIYRTVAGSVA